MKAKLLVCSLLSVVGVALTAVPASAFFGLFHRCHCDHSTTIVCRPYNAFTPVCSGTMICNGCCPIGPQAYGGGMMGDACGNGMAAMPFNGVNLGMMPHPSAYVGAPMPMPASYPTNAAPMPGYQPQPVPAPNTQTYAPMNQGFPVQPATFQNQNPVFQPIYPMVQPPQAPAYWYGN